MIRAEFSHAGEKFRLCIDGHANYSESGSDIVCAAVSGIFYSLLGYLANECESLYIRSLCSGHVDIECGAEGLEAMKLACIGLLQISLSYPDCVKLENSVFSWRVGVAR